ncbi:MAG: DUF4064 domain-containing protein [Methanothrix sp.]|uniref:DUF4064 domain-containing protein n=1 Tax=Methanothrix sp. TaxID=90426 RepID=UPI0032AF8B70|nr:DUF4064 domain-containing protein [Methanothrix sp.]
MSRNAELALGIVGGLFGILTGIIVMFIGGIGGAVGAEGAETVTVLGFGAILFGITGIVGGALVTHNHRAGGALMLLSGILGFVTTSAFWIIAGLILIAGGILALRSHPTSDQSSMRAAG